MKIANFWGKKAQNLFENFRRHAFLHAKFLATLKSGNRFSAFMEMFKKCQSEGLKQLINTHCFIHIYTTN